MNLTYKCPLCGANLIETVGNSIHPGDPNYGIGLACPSHECPAQEVAGHSTLSGEKGLKEAFDVITSKFGKHQQNNK